MELVGPAELVALLGVSRTRLTQLAREHRFPEPVARLKAGAIWRLGDIERMAQQTGRQLHYDALAALSNEDDSASRSASGARTSARRAGSRPRA